jgi:hypothetical protein
MVRSPNGKRLVDELMIVCQMPWNEIVKDFPKAKDANTGALPTSFSSNMLQEKDINSSNDYFNQMTQVGYYYNAYEGIYYVMVGSSATIVEIASDKNKQKPNYPYKLDGENILPLSPHGCFQIPGRENKSGCYDRFGKLARNEARINCMAHRYAQKNIDTDRYIKMDDEEGFETLQNDLVVAQQLKAEGFDPMVRISQDSEVQFGDTRTQPLTGEFERMKNVIRSRITEGGVSIGDVDRPTSETATVASFEERNKNRLTNQVVVSNTGESKFIRRVIIDSIEKHIPKSCKTLVATNAKISADDNLAPLEEGVEVPVQNMTLGQVSKYISEKTVYVQSDFSAYEDTGYKLSKSKAALSVAGNTPYGAKILSEMLLTLGYDVPTQKLSPLPEQGGNTGGLVPESNRPLTNQTLNQNLSKQVV